MPMSWTPKVLTITESFPASVDHVHVVCQNSGGTVELRGENYPLEDVTTDIPIGSNGFFDGLEPQAIKLLVQEIGTNGDHGPIQEVPGGPFNLQRLVDGAEGLSITL